MTKEKFHIPMPSDEQIQRELNHIISVGLKPKESFHVYLLRLYKEIGLRNLMPNRWEEFLILLIGFSALLFIPFVVTESRFYEVKDFYAITFLLSPLLFMTLSIYHFTSKIHTATYEVEMVCKYNLYQVAAFRMFVFSIIAILVNVCSVRSVSLLDDDIQFFRAIMISITSLFLFSIIFLFAYLKRQSRLMIAFVIGGWVVANMSLSYVKSDFYEGFLMTIPIPVYLVILALSIGIYFNYLRKLVHFKPVEGVR
ncbi:hypothetical protein [Ornithinibacillus californiensis]|uniref:hypothetical protein n=1 Tax=Ornithinibacillus californiensis TaxID=161536 RepID=UPI00064D9F3A|nr:hypothetical protein [Ornithinibacillus californiensis]